MRLTSLEGRGYAESSSESYCTAQTNFTDPLHIVLPDLSLIVTTTAGDMAVG
jgi:hypothetical protein